VSAAGRGTAISQSGESGVRRSIIATEYRLRLLPIAMAAIVAATAVPIELRGAVWWDGGFDQRDIAENILLYAPLGLACWHRPLRALLFVAVLLSTAIEFSQVWSFGRYASPLDVAANVGGATIGWLAAQRNRLGAAFGVATRPINETWVLLAALGIGVILVAWDTSGRMPSLSNWDSSFPIQLGNEATLDRPWKGEILQLALYPSAARSDSDPTSNKLVGSISGLGPLVLEGGPGIRLPSSASQSFADAVARSNSFRVVGRVATASLAQEGPARIVSFSSDPYTRNFDVGQEGRRIVFRVRTSFGGSDGELFRAVTPPMLESGRITVIDTSFDGLVARIRIDGRLYGRSNIAAAKCTFSDLCDSAVPLVWAALGGMVSMISLALVRWRWRVQALSLGLLTSATLLILLRLLNLATVPIAVQPWTQLMTLFGALTVSCAARWKPEK
jgi:hypothetical protein